MEPQIIIVHDIQKAIEDVGIKPYANTLVQEMGGQYYYVEAKQIDDSYIIGTDYELYIEKREVLDTDKTLSDGSYGVKEIELRYIYKVWSIPNSLAWFIIDCLKLKADAIRLGSNEYREGSQAVYLTAGKEIFGHKIEKLTEIPAELMPVVVERL